MSITFKWGKERIVLPFPQDPSTPLAVLRSSVAEVTGLPRDRFKLVYSGAVMKDDNASIASYRLKPNVNVTVIGTADQLSEPGHSSSTAPVYGRKQAAGPPTQQGTLQAIQAELDAVRTSIKPSLSTFLSLLSSPASAPLIAASTPSSAPPFAPPVSVKPREEHTRLGELLLQALLRLDAITPESEWADARSARKLAVKEVQGLLDELDEAWRTSELNQSRVP